MVGYNSYNCIYKFIGSGGENIKKRVFVILIFLTFFLCCNFAFAGDVNETLSNSHGNLLTESNSFKDIQDLVDNADAGGTIFLNGKTYTGNGTQITLNKPITIDGASSADNNQKSILDGNLSSRILLISGTHNITLKNIIFQNAKVNGNGHAIYQNTGNLTIQNCEFRNINNTVTGAIDGGVIRSGANSNIYLENVKAYNIYLKSPNYIDGFFMYIGANCKVKIINYEFFNNTLNSTARASYSCLGAMVYCAGQRCEIEAENISQYKNKFISSCLIEGTSFYLKSNSKLNLSNFNYTENYIRTTSNSVTGVCVLLLEACQSSINTFNFRKNNISSGKYTSGAIFASKFATVDIKNVEFIDNTFNGKDQLIATLYRTYTNVITNISNVIIKSNNVSSPEVFGFCYFNTGNNININNITFSDNYAYSNSLIYTRGILTSASSNITINNFNYYNNVVNSTNTSYGTVLRIISSNSIINLLNINIYNNTVYAKSHKGIIYSTGKNNFTVNLLNISNNKVFNDDFYVDDPYNINSTNIQGCAMLYGQGTISNCIFKNNYYNAGLGIALQIAPYSREIPITVDNCEFFNNTGGSASKENNRTYFKDHGGAICVSGIGNGSTIIRNCVFTSNVNSQGGAITPHNNCIIENCRFINNTATKFYGGAISTEDGIDLNNANITIKNCYFEGNAAPIGGAIQAKGNYVKIYDCTFKDNDAVQGGAVFLEGNNLTVINCTFIDNNATYNLDSGIVTGQTYLPQVQVWNAYGGAIYIHGNDAKLNNNKFWYNSAIHSDNNTFEGKGGAIYIYGDNASLVNSYFDDNFAHSGNGSAIYVLGLNTTINTCEFYRHNSGRGTVFIRGSQANILNSIFKSNTASRGGAGVYSIGNHSLVDNCIFEDNNATIHGGAIHSHGDYIKVLNSKFISNNAHPSDKELDKGLGGAIFSEGNFNDIAYCEFDFNTARNGSAIYNRGSNLTIEESNFHFNQAYSYNLFISVTPEVSNYTKNNKIIVNITHIGGDNIINAIYNDGDYKNIFFYNVTYEHSSTSGGKRTSGLVKVNPVKSAEESKNGELIYQDSREDLQVINLIITRESEANDLLGASISGDIIQKLNGRTGLYGNISFDLTGDLKPGKYNVYASHPDDWLYKSIENLTSFVILPHVDLEITKSSDKDTYFVGNTATFTITVTSLGTDAHNVIVKEILPDSFEIIDFKASEGSFKNNTWSGFDVLQETSQTLLLKVKLTKTGTFTNIVNVTTTDNDTDLSNNVANKTVNVIDYVDLKVTKTSNVKEVKLKDKIVWIITITNKGTINATGVKVTDKLSKSLKYMSHTSSKGKFNPKTGIWDIGELEINETATLKLITKAISAGKITNIVKATSNERDINITNNHANFTVKVKTHENEKKSEKSHSNKNAISNIESHTTANPILLMLLALMSTCILFKRKN